MIIFFILEVVFLPVYLLYIKILHKQGQLTENRFGLLVITYLSLITLTAFSFLPTASAGRIVGHILTFLCWFPGYSLARRMYRQIFPHQ